MKKFDTGRYRQTQKLKDASSDPASTPYSLGVRGQPLCISGAAFLHLQTRELGQRRLSIISNGLNSQTFFLFSHSNHENLLEILAVQFSSYTGCPDLGKALKSSGQFHFQNFGEEL